MRKPQEVYELVVSGKLKQFPQRFWKGREGKKRAGEIIRHLQKKLRIPVDELPWVFTARFFRKHKLGGMMNHAFGNSPSRAIRYTYPGSFNEWELNAKNKWAGKRGKLLAKKATRELFRKLGIPDKKIPEYATKNLFQDYGLKGMLDQLFNGSVYRAILNAYPKRFSWEELQHAPKTGRIYISKHGHTHKSIFERRIDDYVGELGLDHKHNVKYPGSRLDADIVLFREGRAVAWIECVGMLDLKSYRKRLEKKRKIAKEKGLRLIEIYLKDNWRQIKRKLRKV